MLRRLLALIRNERGSLQVGNTAIQAVTVTISGTVDVSDRAARLAGIVTPSVLATSHNAAELLAGVVDGQVLCDSGQLAAGTYRVRAEFTTVGSSSGVSAPVGVRLQHRNAANAANNLEAQAMQLSSVGTGHVEIGPAHFVVVQNERFRLVARGGFANNTFDTSANLFVERVA